MEDFIGHTPHYAPQSTNIQSRSPLIPTEILCHIFERYLEGDPAKVINLQLVSRTWCAAANGHPPLWTRIIVMGPFSSEKVLANQRYIETCTQRSGILLLHVRFWTQTPHSNDLEVLGYLCRSANDRWFSFTCTLAGNHVYNGEAFDLLLHAILNTPRLRVLRVSDQLLKTRDVPNPSVEVIQRNSCQLVGLEIVIHRIIEPNYTYEQRPHWLHFFPSVRRLTLRADPGLWAGDRELEGCTAARLTHLILYGIVPPWCFRNLTLPALRIIRIKPGHQGEHALDKPYLFQQINVTTPIRLTLSCSGCRPFWDLVKETGAIKDRFWNQDSLLCRLVTLSAIAESVEACGCIWGELYRAFDNKNDEIEEAARHSCPRMVKISLVTLTHFMRDSINRTKAQD